MPSNSAEEALLWRLNSCTDSARGNGRVPKAGSVFDSLNVEVTEEGRCRRSRTTRRYPDETRGRCSSWLRDVEEEDESVDVRSTDGSSVRV